MGGPVGSPGDDGAVGFEGYGVVVASGDLDDIGETCGHGGLAHVVAAPCDDGAVAFEGERVAAAGGECGDIREAGGNGGLALIVGAPREDASIAGEGVGGIEACGDELRAAECGGDGGLVAGIPAPAGDFALAIEREVVVVACGDLDDILEVGWHIALAGPVCAPDGDGSVSAKRGGAGIACSDLDDAIECRRNGGLAIRVRTPCDDIAFLGRALWREFVDLMNLDDLVGGDIFEDALQPARPVNRDLRGLRLVGKAEGEAGFGGGTDVRAEILGEGGGGSDGVFALEEVVKKHLRVRICPPKPRIASTPYMNKVLPLMNKHRVVRFSRKPFCEFPCFPSDPFPAPLLFGIRSANPEVFSIQRTAEAFLYFLPLVGTCDSSKVTAFAFGIRLGLGPSEVASDDFIPARSDCLLRLIRLRILQLNLDPRPSSLCG